METQNQGPLHFHLLSDTDLTELTAILKTVSDRRREIVSCWYRKYLEHFGDWRSLSEPEFVRVFEQAIERGHTALIGRDMAAYADGLVHLGGLLAERGVALEEAIPLLAFFEECVRIVFHQEFATASRARATLAWLGRINTILLVSAYFRSDSAVAMERVIAAEREGARQTPDSRTWFRGMVGASTVMREFYRRIEAADGSRESVLIVGEAGTGKETAARAIHSGGPRSEGPFVVFNCAGVNGDEIERQLFGDPGGDGGVPYLGALRAADGGTLFLDEVTALSPRMQSVLLKLIQNQTAMPHGGGLGADVQIIASTTRVPEEALADGKLRSDLYFRLRASTLKVPALRDRRGDLLVLAEHFIEVFNARLGRGVLGIDEPAMGAMLEYSWPGNVRELSSVIEGALSVGKSQFIELTDLPEAIQRCEPLSSAATNDRYAQVPVVSFAEMERELIRRALETTGHNKLRAAGLLRISRKKLYAKIRQHGL
jgi:DNA-binding NtrC family response regulator